MNLLNRSMCRAWLAATSLLAGAPAALAGLGGDIPDVEGTVEPGTGTEGIRSAILDALALVLNFLALIAVIFIIIAGIRLIVSQGEEEQKDKAKKTILYVIVGLIVILFARVIVGFFANLGDDIGTV